MNRQDLVDKLQLVAPALSNNDLVPVLQHFWFQQDILTCYNDHIAIQTPLKSGFTGAIPATLTSLLSVSRAKEVEFDLQKDGVLIIKAASSKIKLPYLTENSFDIFSMPKATGDKLPVDMTAFLEAIESCSRSLKEDTSMPDSLGITIAYYDKGLDLYATNDSTISYARVKCKQELKDFRVVISGEFCRQMLALSKLDGSKSLELHGDYSLFTCGDNLLFGRLVDVQRPLDFQSVIDNSFPVEAEKDLVSIPSKLELILDRAVVITESKQDRPKTSISIKGGVAKFFSQSSDKGEVYDSVQLEQHHPDVEVSIDPRLFKAGWGAYDKMLLTEQCLVMSKDSSLYLVSASH